MEYIAHRINTVEDLEKVPCHYGVELDIRDTLAGNISLQHEPFTPGEDFETFLQKYQHGTMIINVKSERVELRALELLQRYGIKTYFFLDSSFPMINLLVHQGEDRVALRYSEYEGMDTLLRLAGKIKWVWVDCFTKMPLTREDYLKIKDCGYKICIVSPDLTGREHEIEMYGEILHQEQIEPDAVCTKLYNITRWQTAVQKYHPT